MIIAETSRLLLREFTLNDVAARRLASARVAEKVGLKIDAYAKYRDWDVRIYRKSRAGDIESA
ncbi:hypothetical protein SAMN04488490_1110 [Marinobacter sp. LV10R510-11A]|uniref:hypothetical protein n=1 Tax=Marinobacter sp. LV10R510-11A TaxID=1415568 RepID=UPI000BB72EB6|nr:hypothetical protein [Marinobacter sp. LV10R510-11A]SOB75508.1 hypothetical protein SAMN04488490_1110 [Marinobacter sp. LV10R510-11A]